jgi:hypothetical protein
MISIILYLCILWTYAETNKTVDITAVAKPHAKGNEISGFHQKNIHLGEKKLIVSVLLFSLHEDFHLKF